MAGEEYSGAASGAAQGAVIGSVVPGVGTLVGAGIGGLAGYVGGKGAGQSSRAAQAAAQAQAAEARRQYDLNSGILQGGADRLQGATVAGLASLDKDMANQERNLARQEAMISQIDPTVIEASQQALKLMRGEQSSTLQPFQNQRNMQRQKLVNRLREQLGPGAETSTAGIQALTRFDSESDQLFAGAQQQALSNLGNTFGQFNSGRPDIGREIGLLSNYGQQKVGLAQNQSNYDLQRVGALAGSGAQLMQTAGSQFLGAQLQGQYQQNQANQFLNAGATAAGAMLGRGKSGTENAWGNDAITGNKVP